MFNSECAMFCWLAIALGAIFVTLGITEGRTEIERERTKQFEIQLQIVQAWNPTNRVDLTP